MARILGIVIWVVIIVLVFHDAKSRNMNPWVWAVLVFFFSLIALIIYFLVRKPKS